MDDSDVEVETLHEEIVVDDDDDIEVDPDVVLLQEDAGSPNIIDITGTASNSSSGDIFEVDTDEDSATVDDGDSEATDATDAEGNDQITAPRTPPLPQFPPVRITLDNTENNYPTLPQLPDAANQQAPLFALFRQPRSPQLGSPRQQSTSTGSIPIFRQPLQNTSASTDNDADAGNRPSAARAEDEAAVQNTVADIAARVSNLPTETPSAAPIAAPMEHRDDQDAPQVGVVSAPERVGVIAAAVQRRLNSGLNESISEFRSPKRRKHSSPEKTVAPKVESDDESDCCPICFEPWTTSGNHRLASLKCGHLFGQSCIDRWLKGQGGKCPQCNAKAKRQDIRVLYTKSISAVDTTERDRALADLEKEKESRRKAEMEAAHSRLQYQLSVEECNRLRAELTVSRAMLNQLRSQMSGGQPMLSQSTSLLSQSTSATGGKRFVPDRTVKIWEGGQCRVLAYSPSLAALIVSQPSSSTLFPGFGIKKLSAMDFKTSQYMTTHSKAIRDVCFHPTQDNGILLSCGLDKTAKMTSIMSNTVVQTYQTKYPVWSCEWNVDDANYFYTGLNNGSVLEFDIRNTQSHVQQLNTEGNSPVAALKYIPHDHNAAFRQGGLVVGQLHRTSFFEKKGEGQPRLNFLPLEGSLTSLSFDLHTRHFLASFRPTVKHNIVRHQLCEMTSTSVGGDPGATDRVCSSNIIHTFHGGRTQTVLSKSALLPNPGDVNSLLACAGDETSNSIFVWNCQTGDQIQKLSMGAFVLDFASVTVNNQHFLVALTDKMLKVQKWC